MKRLLLVNTNTEQRPYPVPPLGLCMLAEALGSRYDVRIYDGVFDEGRNLPDLVKEFSPDYIGFSIRNIDDVVMDRPVYYVDTILKNFIGPLKKITNVPVILGGSGFSIFPKELMELSGADWGVTGEGEEVLPFLLERLDSGKDLHLLPKILSASWVSKYTGDTENGDWKRGFADIDRHLPFGNYIQKGAYPIQTKRGCSHGCIYCNYPVIEGKTFRPRDPAQIAEEIALAAERLGPVTFEFVDSTFNDPEGHAEAICREIIKKKIKVRLRTMGINPRHTGRELFDLMMEAGFAQIDATPDSASPLLLKNLGKGFRLDDVQKMARLIHEYNLPTMWFFLLGGPGESESTIHETADFIREYVNPADLVYLNAGLRIYPGTPLQKIAIREGLIRKDDPLLHPSVYYFSQELGKAKTDHLVREISKEIHNCIPAVETAPPPEMIKEAMELRKSEGIDEPMFRTLIRLRREWIRFGKLVIKG